MMQILAAFEKDRAGGIILEHLIDAGSEMVVERCPLPYTHVLAAFLVVFIDLGLHDDGDALHEEDSA